jgi:hypothetical protein
MFSDYRNYDQSRWSISEPREVDTLKGACILISRKTISEVGKLDEDYYMYTEEIDFCYRTTNAGLKIYWYPKSEVMHYGGQSTRLVATNMFIELYRSKIAFIKKHYGVRTGISYKCVLFAASLLRLPLVFLALFETGDRRLKYHALANNYLKLITALPKL